MEKVWEKVEYQTTVYVAEDGQKFNTAIACRRHEVQLKAKLAEDVVVNIPCFSFLPQDYYDDCEITFYKVRNKEELEAVKAVSFSDPDANGWDFDLEEYPCWVRVVVDKGYEYGELETADSVIREAEKYIAELKAALLEADQAEQGE